MSEINTANETPEFPRDRLSNVSSTTSSPADDPQKATLREVIATMPLRVKMASIWLFLVFFNDIRQDRYRLVGRLLPLQNPNFQTNGSTPQPAHLAAVSQLQESPPLTGWEPMQLLRHFRSDRARWVGVARRRRCLGGVRNYYRRFLGSLVGLFVDEPRR